MVLKQKLLAKGFVDDDIELGFIENLNQYGIIRIKKLKPKLIYNYNGNGKYLLKQKGKEDIIFIDESKTLHYLINNF